MNIQPHFATKIALLVVVLATLAGCDTKERDALKVQVATLSQDLATAQGALAVAETELTQTREELSAVTEKYLEIQAQLFDQSDVLATVNAELESVKSKLAKPAAKKK